MLKALMLLECDECHETFHRVGLGSESTDWQMYASSLTAQAGDDGWEQVWTEETRTYGLWCPDCQF